MGVGTLANFKAPFDFHEVDPATKRYVPITDPVRRAEIGRQISPITHVSADDPPMLIIHGDADKLVPIQQAELIVARCKAEGVNVNLVVKAGAAHGWTTMGEDLKTIADWFDKHLAAK